MAHIGVHTGSYDATKLPARCGRVAHAPTIVSRTGENPVDRSSRPRPRPADYDSPLSVSIQNPTQKEMAGSLRIFYAAILREEASIRSLMRTQYSSEGLSQSSSSSSENDLSQSKADAAALSLGSCRNL